MKKIITVLLSLLVACLPFTCAFAVDGSVEMCVISDVHFKHASIVPGENLADDETELYFRGGITGQMDYESNAIFKSFQKEYLKSSADILLVTGDITNGNLANHKEIASYFAELEKAGKRVFVINGNHDIGDEGDDGYTSPEVFAEVYGDFGFSEAVARDATSLSYTAELGAGYRLLAIDSCIYGEDTGRITEETFSWVQAQLDEAKRDGVTLVAMMHHSLLPHMGLYSLTGMQIDGSDDFINLLADGGVDMIFTGHFHANDITVSETANSNEIHDIMTGSLITYPNSYRTVKVSGNTAEVKTDYITSVNISDLPDCFSNREKQLIESDFSAYGKGFFFAGIKNWVNSYLGSARKISKLLKIDRDSAIGKKLDELMPNISTALTMPIYGENSLQSIAALAGYTIPESDYNSLAEIAATILCSVYSGDESLGKNSLEVRVLYSALRSALTYALCGIAGVLDTNAVGVVSSIAHSTVAADEFILRFIAPIMNGLTSDAYAPGDLNVTLELDGTGVDGLAPLTFIQYVKFIIQKIFEMLVV